MRSFTFNTDCQSSVAAQVESALNPRPVTDAFTVELGEAFTSSLYLASPSATNGYDPLSGSDTLTVIAVLGQRGGTPTAGQYTLSFGAQATTALPYNATVAQIQAALVALSSIAGNNVVVSGQFPSYNVQFIGTLALAPQALIQVQSSLLSAASTVTVSNVQIGSGVQNAIQSLTFQALPAVYQGTWTPIVVSGSPVGWTCTLSFTSTALIQMFTPGQPYIYETLEFSFTAGSATFKYSCQLKIYASIAALSGGGTGVNPDSMSGIFSIGNGVATGTVTALNLPSVPRSIEATVLTPAGGFVLAVSIDFSTITTDGFTFNLSGLTDQTGYKLSYTLTF